MVTKARHILVRVVVLATLAPAMAGGAVPGPVLKAAANLRDLAHAESDAWRIAASLTTEVGPRAAGSAGDRAAVAWALATLGELGFDEVRPQSVTVPAWERGEADVRIVQPYPQALAATALGHTVGTPEEGIEAPVLRVESLAALEAMTAATVRGHIVFIDQPMSRTRDGESYGDVGPVRNKGPSVASQRGAVAVVIRSLATSNARFPHTGSTKFEQGVRPIPAFALAVPDADMLARQASGGEPVQLHVRSTARPLPAARSANVIGEIRGASRPEEIVLLGAHLDSWDLGTGAVDDAAGVAIVTEVGRLIAALPRRPARTIRVVLFANEEAGLDGAKAYHAAAAEAGETHVVGLESDLGSGRLYALNSGVGEGALALVEAMRDVLAPLGIEGGDNASTDGADLTPLREAGMPVLSLAHDASRYFDWHHSADDTLDKVDPEALKQAVAAYATVAWIAAEIEDDFGRFPKPPETPADASPPEASADGR
jgi:Zn-dependent M28 family amino/carboxypeptidase